MSLPPPSGSLSINRLEFNNGVVYQLTTDNTATRIVGLRNADNALVALDSSIFFGATGNAGATGASGRG